MVPHCMHAIQAQQLLIMDHGIIIVTLQPYYDLGITTVTAGVCNIRCK